nr:hypothetical protein [Tanacetum cinerariifolium]
MNELPCSTQYFEANKKILIEKMESNKSIHRSDEQKNLCKALVDTYECDKLILDTYRDTVTLKRRRDDEDKEEEPSARLNRGSKRRREGKEPQSTKPAPQEFETGATNDQPVEEKQVKPPTPDSAWNKTLPATHGRIQPWISNLAKKADSRTLFNELMDTPIDFSAFVMNQLKVDTLTTELLADWNNPEGQQYPHDLLKPLPLISNSWGHRVIPFDHFINKDLEYLRGGASSQKESLIGGANINNSMDLRSIGNLLEMSTPNLESSLSQSFKSLNDITTSIWIGSLSDLKRKEAYTAYSSPRGFIYQNKDKQNRLIRIDGLHKFSDNTLNDVWTALDDCLKGIWMQYLPQTIWRQSDKDRAASMIQAIDKKLKTRRIMRSLEKFVGGRLYGGDFWLL